MPVLSHRQEPSLEQILEGVYFLCFEKAVPGNIGDQWLAWDVQTLCRIAPLIEMARWWWFLPAVQFRIWDYTHHWGVLSVYGCLYKKVFRCFPVLASFSPRKGKAPEQWPYLSGIFPNMKSDQVQRAQVTRADTVSSTGVRLGLLHDSRNTDKHVTTVCFEKLRKISVWCAPK